MEDLSIPDGNFSFVCSSGKGTSSRTSGQQEKSAAEGGSSEDKYSRFTLFSKWDPIFHGRPWLEKQDRGGQGGDKDDGRYHFLKSLNPFSLFAREFDFYRKYDGRVSKKKCFKCEDCIMLLSANEPCRHYSPLCRKCICEMNKHNNGKPNRCLFCNTEVKKTKYVAWPQIGGDQKPPEQTFNEDFPALDSKAFSAEKKKNKRQ